MALPPNELFCIGKVDEVHSQSMASSHIHDYYEIYYLIEGKRRYFINHTLYDVEPGDAILVKRGDIHQTQSASDARHERFLLTFSEEFLEGMISGLGRDMAIKCFSSAKIHIPTAKRHTFEALLDKLYAEYQRTNDPYSHYLAQLHLCEVLITLSKWTEQNTSPLIDDLNIQEERIQNAAHYICNYYNQPITLEGIAKIAYMSPTYFSKKFKKVTGLGFNEYLNSVRVKMATNMLLETQYSITEIAMYCGYQDSNYFGDVFKKIIGSSPSKYRKQHLGATSV